jgi:hypothetical protein
MVINHQNQFRENGKGHFPFIVLLGDVTSPSPEVAAPST